MTYDPEHIAISKSKGIIIDWKDGHRSEYSPRLLRDKCPCAGCTGAHGGPPAAANPFQMYKPAPAMLGVKPVGRYAIKINWNDGHNAGIYSYEHFRRICPCPECQATSAEPPA